VCACSPAGQQYPGFHQKRDGQQGEGGDYHPLFCTCEVPAGIPCPSLGPTTQERCGVFGEGAKEGQEDAQRAGATLLQRQAEGAGLLQSGEEKERRDCKENSSWPSSI